MPKDTVSASVPAEDMGTLEEIREMLARDHRDPPPVDRALGALRWALTQIGILGTKNREQTSDLVFFRGREERFKDALARILGRPLTDSGQYRADVVTAIEEIGRRLDAAETERNLLAHREAVRLHPEVRAKLEAGDMLDDVELRDTIVFYERAVVTLQQLGPEFRLPLKECRFVLDRLHGWKEARAASDRQWLLRKLEQEDRVGDIVPGGAQGHPGRQGDEVSRG